MKRRQILAGLGGLAGVSGVLGTGAFTSVRAERSVSVAVAADENAFLSMEPSETINGRKFATVNGGQLALDFGANGRGQGVGTDSSYYFDDVFTVTNQGTQSVYVWGAVDADGFGSDDAGVWFYPGDDRSKLLERDSDVVELPVGDTVHLGVHIDTTGATMGEMDLSATITASGSKPDSAEPTDAPDDEPYAPSSLQGYYPFNGDVSDATDNANDGSISGSTAAYESGVDGDALNLDESTHVDLAEGDTFGFKNFTVSVWARVDDADSDELRTVVERASKDQNSRTFVIWFDDSDAYFGSDVIASKTGTEATPSIVAADPDDTDGEWHHIVVTVEADEQFVLYVDGEKKKRTISGTPYTGDATTRVGRSAASDYPDRYLEGDVDELRIYDRALTAAEVKSLYRIDKS